MPSKASAENSIVSIEDLDHVVDCDFHLTERPSDFLPYVDSPWDEILARPLEDIHKGRFLSPLYPKSGILNVGRTTGRIPPTKVTTPEDVREGMEELGVTEPILNAGTNLSLGVVHHDELAVALANAYNRWVTETFFDEGFRGAAVIAPHRPNDAAEEIDRVSKEKGVIGILLPSGGVTPPLGHEMYRPIFEACESAGLPLLLHGTANGAWQSQPLQHRWLNRHMSIHAVSHPFDHMTHLTSMLTAGVPALYPDLDFVVQEAGIGWVPYLMRRLDHELPANVEDAPLLEMAPSKYIRRQFYFTTQPVEGTHDHEYVRAMIRLMSGGTNLMFSSDYPHYDFDNTDHLLNVLRPAFSDEEIANIYGETARKVYDL
ncbi:amidohydrolase family protein [Haloferax sp. MBLA0076]|uniref:Amidohydrolase family protein n=2 Tax=Haloferacaceae TaxID=1644056 RepID=A0A6A8GJX8_9EURY|nr:amidohydrolase [Haloferax sp. CBA1148]MRX23405.1 amidohydrolase family protein [Haloferax litoreum]